jgi:hypothetical protein
VFVICKGELQFNMFMAFEELSRVIAGDYLMLQKF